MLGEGFTNYIAKLKNWMFPQDEGPDDIEKRSIKKHSPSNANEDVRMIHQYPKQGAFRFPLMKDEIEKTSRVKKDQNVKQREKRKRSEQKQEQEPKSESSQERKKFQGHHFSARTIPSPIHGYQHLTKKSEDIQNITDEQNQLEESNTPLFHSKEVEVLTEHESEQVPERYEQEETKEKETKLELPSNNEQTAKQQERVVPLRKDKIIHQRSDRTKEVEKKSRSSIKKVRKEKEVPANRSNVPFNVLMQPQDRARQKKREKNRLGDYSFPPLHLLNVPRKHGEGDEKWLAEKRQQLNDTFEYFNVKAKVVHVTKGPSVTRFEVQPEPGVKVSKIVNLTDDLKLSLAAKEIRIEAPIPGKNTVGVEVPNRTSEAVFLREILHHPSFQQSASPLTVAMGMDISGEPVVTDLQKMPHGLIAGATGSGKSVCVNSILTSLIYKASPSDVRMLLIDPKMVELAPYNDVPHLAAPVITDPKEATEGLKWAVAEMERRYECLAKAGARDIARYNEKMKQTGQRDKHMPYLVIVVDELADLMMVSPQDVEEAICRIAQKARACGIHLLVATQRPSVDVITGLIKANIPTRVAFSVSSQADSRTILDGGGAERLLGKGDMLLLENGSSKPIRIQGTFVTDDEIDRVVDCVKRSPRPEFLFEQMELKEQIAVEGEDDLFEEACDFVRGQQAASASLLQRRFRMGYNRAARLIDVMEEKGIVSPARGSKPREVYLTKHDQKEENR